MDRDNIHIICRHSNWSKESVDKVLRINIFNNAHSWIEFIQILFITLGIGFTTIGVIFFFAYNWAELHKFVKLGIIEILVFVTTIISISPKLNLNIRNIILTGAGIQIGILFAVFGQIYQTGANAYDFFLGWTVFISLWVFISKFPPMWMLYLILINTTLILYSQQVAQEWSVVFVFNLFFITNIFVLIVSIRVSKFTKKINIPTWFINSLAIVTAIFSTIGITYGIFSDYEISFVILIFLVIIFYSLGFKYSLNRKDGLYLALISLSIIIMISSLFIKVSDEAGMFLFTSIFIVISISIVIKRIIDFQKKWINEK